MRACVTGRRGVTELDLLPASQTAPSLALPWIVKLRYGMLLGVTAALVGAEWTFDLGLPHWWLVIPVAVMLASNLGLHWRGAAAGSRTVLGLVLTLDTLCYTALLALTGGPANPFTVLYLVLIAFSTVVLSRAWTWALGGLALAGYAFLFRYHYHVHLFHEHTESDGFSVHLAGMWLAFAAAALVITVFVGRVSQAMRQREQDVLALRELLARQQRLSSIATLAAGAAHELGTPLGTIAIASRELERRSENDPELAQDARLIRSEVERCRDILRQMSAQGAEPAGELPAAVAPAEILERVRAVLPPDQRALLRTDVAGNPGPAVLPAEATKQALTALVRNALDASPPGRTVHLSAERCDGWLRFRIKDEGCGMTPEMMDRIAEPFFTTKAAGQGMGLGTFLARSLAERLGGSLTFESAPGAGTVALLELPLNP